MFYGVVGLIEVKFFDSLQSYCLKKQLKHFEKIFHAKILMRN